MARPPRGSSGSDIGPVIEAARAGTFAPVHVLLGTERFLIERAIGLLRRASLGDGPPGFNDDVFHGAAGLSGAKVVAAARTLPMMARARFVLVRDVDKMSNGDQQAIAEYIPTADDSTCLVLVAEKLHGSGKLLKAAKAAKVIAEAQPMKGPALSRFAKDEAQRRGHALTPRAAEALVESVGEDLAAIDDAIERLSLYVGEGTKIDVGAVEACVSRIAADSIWALVDAVGMRDVPKALAAAGSLLDNREEPLRILAMIARQLRIVARMRDALKSGLRGRDAALEAGAPPFKAAELTASAGRFSAVHLAFAFDTLADADLALKGSKRPGELVLEEAILALCAGRPRVRERVQRTLRTYR
ncbi:MAG: DNA polymerase III subunit delta [Sandaracinaceae bacterium]|nr:DNA polymerase III subunit delta [Sandaracinaceae bacterium]